VCHGAERKEEVVERRREKRRGEEERMRRIDGEEMRGQALGRAVDLADEALDAG